MAAFLTLAGLNAALRQAGIDGRVRRGAGWVNRPARGYRAYLYVEGPAFEGCRETVLAGMPTRVADASLELWLSEVRALADESAAAAPDPGPEKKVSRNP